MIRLNLFLKDGRQLSGVYNLPMTIERIVAATRSNLLAGFYLEAA